MFKTIIQKTQHHNGMNYEKLRWQKSTGAQAYLQAKQNSKIKPMHQQNPIYDWLNAEEILMSAVETTMYSN